MKTVVFIGRWQSPSGPHAGHRYLIEKALEEGHRVIIGIRDMPKDEKNPHDVETRMYQFRKLYGDRVSFISIFEDGDGLELWYGRGVGWGIKEIVVPDDVAVISATRLRKLEGSTIWLTGLPCSGKTTIAKILKDKLEDRGFKVLHLDGDALRTGLCVGLGFSDEGRKENLRRVSCVAEIANRDGITVIASYVSPTEELRQVVYENITNMNMVYVKCSIETCAKRDVKGMWEKARKGEITGFTGHDAPYDPPQDPRLVVDTDMDSTADDSADRIIKFFGV